jgi:hypothetical protein
MDTNRPLEGVIAPKDGNAAAVVVAGGASDGVVAVDIVAVLAVVAVVANENGKVVVLSGSGDGSREYSTDGSGDTGANGSGDAGAKDEAVPKTLPRTESVLARSERRRSV